MGKGLEDKRKATRNASQGEKILIPPGFWYLNSNNYYQVYIHLRLGLAVRVEEGGERDLLIHPRHFSSLLAGGGISLR